MGRHFSNVLTITGPLPGKAKPFKAAWRETVNGERAVRAKFFATLAEAETFKAAVETESANLPPAPGQGSVRRQQLPQPVLAPAAQRGGTVEDDQHPRFRTFAERVMRDVVEESLAASTVRSYRGLLDNHILPAVMDGGQTFGDLAVGDDTIGVAQIIAVVNGARSARKDKQGKRIAARLPWGTKAAIFRCLRAFLTWAVQYRHLRANPALQLMKRIKPATAEDPEPNPLTLQQMQDFLQWVQTGRVPGRDGVDGPRRRNGRVHTPGYPEWHFYFLLLFRTGMRRGEAAEVKWTQLSLEDGTALLKHSHSPSERIRKGGRPDGQVKLKTKRPHEIELSGDVVTALRLKQVTRLKQASPFVCVTATGRRILSDCSQADRIFTRGMQALRLTADDHTIHDTRDTFATCHLLQDPAKLLWVSWMLGHGSTATTLKRYTRYVPEQHSQTRFASDLDQPRMRPDDGKAVTGD